MALLPWPWEGTLSRRFLSAGAIALALALAGCSAGAASLVPATPMAPTPAIAAASPSPSVVSTGSPQPSASPSEPASQDQIRYVASRAYIQAANVSNRAGAALNKKYPTFTSIARARAFYKAAAGIEGTFIKGIRGLICPTDTVSDAHAFVARLAAVQALYIEGSVAKTVSDLVSVSNALTGADRAASAAANLLRGDLGLPPVPG
jgi:hypothetical protein